MTADHYFLPDCRTVDAHYTTLILVTLITNIRHFLIMVCLKYWQSFFDTISAVVLSILLIDSGISAFWKVLECT